MKEGDIVVASDRKSKLWKNISLKRAMQEWSMKNVNIARCPGSATRVFTSSERLANQLKKNETDDPQVWGNWRSWKIGGEDRDGRSTRKKNNEEG